MRTLSSVVRRTTLLTFLVISSACSTLPQQNVLLFEGFIEDGALVREVTVTALASQFVFSQKFTCGTNVEASPVKVFGNAHGEIVAFSTEESLNVGRNYLLIANPANKTVLDDKVVTIDADTNKIVDMSDCSQRLTQPYVSIFSVVPIREIAGSGHGDRWLFFPSILDSDLALPPGVVAKNIEEGDDQGVLVSVSGVYAWLEKNI